jgi:hypothetical protein
VVERAGCSYNFTPSIMEVEKVRNERKMNKRKEKVTEDSITYTVQVNHGC